MIVSPVQRPAWRRYAVAVLAVAVATVVHAWCLPALGVRAPYILFYPAVILAALYGRLRAGLLATFLSACAATYFVIGRQPEDWLGLGLFCISCMLISGTAEAMHRAQVRAGEAEAQVKLAGERRRAEAELYRFKLLAEHSRDVILFMRRDDGRILEVNAAAVAAYGYTRDELLSLAIQDLRADGSRAPIAAQMDEADTHSILFETVHRRKDGGTFPVEVSSQGATIGGVRTLISVVRDITERRRLEQELRDREERLRLFIEHAPAAVAMFDQQMRYLAVSRRWLADFRLGGQNLVGRSHYEVFPEIPERWKEIHRRCLAGAVETCEEDPFPRADGSLDWIRWEVRPWRDARDHIGGIVVFSEQIGARKRAEEALRQQREWLRVTITSIGDAVLATDTVGGVTFLNPVAAELTGWTSEQALGLPAREVFRIINEDTREPAEDIVQRVLREGSPVTLANHTALVARDGREIPIEDSAAPIKDDTGRVAGAVLVFHDVTEKRRAQQALRQATEQRLLALEGAGLGAWDYRFDTDEVFWDERCRNMFGFPSGGQIDYGEAISRIHPEDRAATDEAVKQAIAGAAAGAYHREFRVVWPDGSLHWIASHGRVHFEGEERRAVRFLGVNLDITGRKHAEEALRESQKLESIGLLAGGIAHDFNNLLVGVIGNASLAGGLLPPGSPVAEILKDILKSGQQAAHLTRQMLAYAGKGRFVVEPVDIPYLVRNAVSVVQSSISKKIAVHLELDPQTPPIESDPSQMQQVFMNLAINAGEAIGSNAGVITVSTGAIDVDAAYIGDKLAGAPIEPGRYCFLQVRDTGCGMDEATKARIFDPFFTTKFAGRGLGLAAVAGIVRAHKGAIMADSAPGRGSCFTVLFPAAVRPAAAPPVVSAVAAGGLRGSGTVLVVDDEEAVRTLARRALERYGYQVLVAESGLAAAEVFKRRADDVAVVILDLSMPESSGEETLPELRKIRPEVKVVISSGYSETETMRLFRGQRVSGFIQKPYTSAGLAERVKAAIGSDGAER